MSAGRTGYALGPSEQGREEEAGGVDALGLGIVWYVVLLFSLTFHEAAHAWAALRGGDLHGHGAERDRDRRGLRRRHLPQVRRHQEVQRGQRLPQRRV